MQEFIDLNADMGESFGAWRMGDDEALLDIVSSANIACGFHGGDASVMLRTVRLAQAKGVSMGAHPGFSDLQGFGRRRILGLEGEDLRALIMYQVGALQALACSVGAVVRHVKLHGALANMATESRAMSDDYMEAMKLLGGEIKIMAMASGEIERAAVRHGLPYMSEIFADRAYNDDGTLVSRGAPGAVITDEVTAAERILRMLDAGAIISESGKRLPVRADSICVHGDNPAAVSMAGYVRERLEGAGIKVRAGG